MTSIKTIEKGHWVALTLKPNTAPMACYVGRVQEIDAKGVRITLIDWIIGTASGWDFYTSWNNIDSALVATSEHDVGRFGEAAGRWQTQMKDLRAEEKPEETEQ